MRRRRHLDSQVDQLWWPWVTSAEDTILDLAESVEIDQLFALLGRAFQRQRTSEAVLLSHLADRSRHARRDLLREVLGDVASGAESTMEVRYLRDVEPAHGLPRGERQVSASPTSAAGTTSGTATNACSSSSTASSVTRAEGRGSATAAETGGVRRRGG